jgi:adenine-specific DNA methylase
MPGNNKHILSGFDITEQFLYNELSLVSDNEIENYFNDLHTYGKLSIIEQKYEYITITNKFNESKIVVQKELFS